MLREFKTKKAGDETEDDDTVESQAGLMDDLANANNNIGQAKAQKKTTNMDIDNID